MSSSTLVVSEVFGPTFQGEGPYTGERVAFVRLGGCNLHCSWCDSAYTWDASRYNLRDELGREDVDTIAAKIAAIGPHRVIVSGGEPLLHQNQPGWAELLDLLAVPVDVETNGTVAPDADTASRIAHFTVSPKLAHSGDPEQLRIVPDVLRTFAELARQGRAILKIVVTHPGEVAEAAALANRVDFPHNRVWVMPEGETADVLMARHRPIAEAALDTGVNFTTRLHTLIWGNERKR